MLGERMARQDVKADRRGDRRQPAEFEPLAAARSGSQPAFGEDGLPELVRDAPDHDLDAAGAAICSLARTSAIVAVLSGGLDAPVLTGPIAEDGSIRRADAA